MQRTVTNSAADTIMTITGKGEVIFFGHTVKLASIDGFETDGTILTTPTLLASSVISFLAEIKVEMSLNSTKGIFFYIDWIDKAGTVDYTPKTNVTFTES